VNVSFNLLAERELNDAVQYYELGSPGLGAAFLTEVESCCDAIVTHPEAGHRVLGSIRRWLVRRFPYAVIYTTRPNEIRVLAVMNLKRRPALIAIEPTICLALPEDRLKTHSRSKIDEF
jgi:plasmid stabilization system protein ParE